MGHEADRNSPATIHEIRIALSALGAILRASKSTQRAAARPRTPVATSQSSGTL
jgi:hypothetical protein